MTRGARRLATVLTVLAMSFATLPMVAATAATTELFFSEYVEGSGDSKALEIYNGTGSAVDLDAGDYSIEIYFNGNTGAGTTIDLTGVVADGGVYVVADDGADSAVLAVADLTSTASFFNGNDAVVLVKGTTPIDVIGQIGVDPGTAWGSGDTSAKDHTLRRLDTVCVGDADGSDAFDPSLEWSGLAQNTFDGLGAHSATCGDTPPPPPPVEPGVGLPLSQGFDDCTLDGWEIISVDEDTDHTWTCSDTYSNIEANGYGDSAAADEWLITPALDLDAQERDTLEFRSYTQYTDADYPQLSVLYSTSYDGEGDPSTATWTELGGITLSAENSGNWTDSGEIDLSGITGTRVHLAFHYTSTGTGSGTAAIWRLDGIDIYSAPLVEPGVGLPLSQGFDDCTLDGWEIISVDEDTDHTWTCSDTYSNIEANGYGDSAAADEWLITPALDLDAQERDTLEFRSYTQYTDADYPQLSVLYSTSYDGEGDPSTATWTELGGITLSAENSRTWTDSGEIDLSGISGTRVHLAFHYTSTGTGSGTAAIWRLDGIDIYSAPPVWVINEIHADPASGEPGDANGDGTRDGTQDEFVEIVNSGPDDLDISGWTISDAVGVRHTFPDNTIVTSSCPVVVFGGGTPTGDFGTGIVQTASSGALGLNNGGDTVTLSNGDTIVATYGYGGEGGDNQSLTRDPDVSGADPLVKHSDATGSGGSLYSPGTKIDGSAFDDCAGPVEAAIGDVQGEGDSSPLVGRQVIVTGVVVGDFQRTDTDDDGDLRGFHIQDENVDENELTSDGIFVYDGYEPAVDVAVGDLVRVTGIVSEYNGLTEISVNLVEVIGQDVELPAAAVLSLPLTEIDDLERYEGMRVTFPQPLYISEYFDFDRYGEIVLTGERQFQPTAVFDPGSPEAAQLAAANALGRIILDDGRTAQNPDPARHPNGGVFDLTNLFRGGDTVENVTGVIDYAQDSYRIQPTAGADYTPVNTRTAAPSDVGGETTVAAFNVLNYFTTYGSRGADDEAEFIRQRDKIFAALGAIDADVVGLIEIENNGTAVADLVSGLNELVGAGTYDYIDTGVIGSDAITVAFIYKPSAVTPLGEEAVLDDPSFLDPNDLGDDKNRPALAQTFRSKATGGVFTAVVNHLKSKGSGCGAGDDDPEAGSCNLTRTLAAQALADWLETDPTGSGDPDFLIIGDLNSYDKEDPIDALTAEGYIDLVAASGGEYAYSYLFGGQLGYLDYAMASEGLGDQVTGTTVWHINADEPDLIDYDMTFKKDAQDAINAPDAYRSSDHDPVIVGLTLTATPEQAIDALMAQVEEYEADGTLHRWQAWRLKWNLGAADHFIERGWDRWAAFMVRRFVRDIRFYQRFRILSYEEAKPLLTIGRNLLEDLR